MAQMWERFVRTAEKQAGRIALVQGEGSISFADLMHRAECLSCAIDVQAGGRVVVCAENSVAVAELLLAVWRCGGVPVLVSARAPSMHIEHAIAKSGAKLAFADDGIAAGHANLRPLGSLGGAENATGLAVPATSAEEIGSIVFTSGSTGLPKGVVQPASNLIDGAERIARLMEYGPSDSILCTVPFSFDYGWGQFLSMVVSGVPLVLPEKANGFELCAALQKHRPTVMAAVPSVLAELLLGLAPVAETDCSSIRLITNTGSRIPGSVLEALLLTFPEAHLSLNYGLTETYRSTSLPFNLAREKPQSVGFPVEGVEIRILREDGTVARDGETGELCHLGAGVFACYWDEPELTARTRCEFQSADGETVIGVRTGDFGYRDADGLLYLEGRRDRLVKCMGIRISLAEIEEAIDRTGLVRDAAVIALDHDVFGSFLVAHVVAPEDVDAAGAKQVVKQLRAQLRESLANYQQPRKIMLHDALPRTGSGKHNLAQLKAMSNVV